MSKTTRATLALTRLGIKFTLHTYDYDPDADRIGISFGVGYHAGPFILDATEFALHFKRRSTQGISEPAINFNGTYKTDANLVTINLGYRF